jgi:hypothetical protein
MYEIYYTNEIRYSYEESLGVYVISIFKSLATKSEGKVPLGIPRLRWEDNITINLT